MIFDFLFENYIDKVFVFFDSQGCISFLLPWINLDYIYITILVCIFIKFMFDVLFIFINGKGKKHGA